MRSIILAAIFMLVAIPAAAQTTNRGGQDDPTVDGQPSPSFAPYSAPVSDGRTATVGNGDVGQRQTRGDAAQISQPMERIQSRIANRVNSRISNRIDRYYDPQFNPVASLRVAEKQLKVKPR